MLYYQALLQRISYMFRPLLGHHHVVLSLQSNCITISANLMGDEISFTVVRYMNSRNGMVPIFAICILYIYIYTYIHTIFCSYSLMPVLTPGRCVTGGGGPIGYRCICICQQ
jgi:hypothetical protein